MFTQIVTNSDVWNGKIPDHRQIHFRLESTVTAYPEQFNVTEPYPLCNLYPNWKWKLHEQKPDKNINEHWLYPWM